MWANIRCLWVNFVRILKYIKQLRLKNIFFAKYLIKLILHELCMAFNLFLKALLPNYILFDKNIAFKTMGEIELSEWTQNLEFVF